MTTETGRSARERWVLGALGAIVLLAIGVLAGLALARGGGPTSTTGPGASPSGAPSPSLTGDFDDDDAPAPDGTCTVDYVVRDSWPDGFTADVTIHNHGAPLDGWELAWWFEGDERIENIWDATVVRPVDGDTGPGVVVQNAPYNADLARDGRVSFGFVGAGTSSVEPGSFELDGRTCGTVKPSSSAQDPDDDAPPSAGSLPAAASFYLDPTTRGAGAAAAATGTERELLEKIAGTPQAFWVTDPDPEAAAAAVRDYTKRARKDGTTGVLALYAVPGRDCGQHSAGGVGESAYARWIDAVADAVVGQPFVVLEPDALPMLGDCDGQGDRIGYLRYAARALATAGARVHVDVGHSGWLSAEEAARRLELVGLDHAVGFALNVSNYQSTEDSIAYGERVAALTGGARYVIDTSRNGNGSDGQWCNPRGRALGERPRAVDDGTHLDALLWVKLPGESDGECNGGPAAGEWFDEIALELARNASW